MRDNRSVLAIVLTAGIAAALLIFASRSDKPDGSEPGEPDAPVWAMFEAQKNGDVRGYLAQLTGEALTGARQAAKEMGQPAFRKYMAERDAQIKGIAVKGRQDGEGGAQILLVDVVYEDGVEQHEFEMRPEGSGWKVAAITGGARHPSLIPYGTPVAPMTEGK